MEPLSIGLADLNSRPSGRVIYFKSPRNTWGSILYADPIITSDADIAQVFDERFS